MLKEKGIDHQWNEIVMKQNALNVRDVNFYDIKRKILRTTRWKEENIACYTLKGGKYCVLHVESRKILRTTRWKEENIAYYTLKGGGKKSY